MDELGGKELVEDVREGTRKELWDNCLALAVEKFEIVEVTHDFDEFGEREVGVELVRDLLQLFAVLEQRLSQGRA